METNTSVLFIVRLGQTPGGQQKFLGEPGGVVYSVRRAQHFTSVERARLYAADWIDRWDAAERYQPRIIRVTTVLTEEAI